MFPYLWVLTGMMAGTPYNKNSDVCGAVDTYKYINIEILHIGKAKHLHICKFSQVSFFE